jgi:hypothetical protein
MTFKFYNAGIFTAGFCVGSTLWHRLTENEKWQHAYALEANVLESYHYIGRQRSVDMIRKSGKKVFLDSGAFSMWSLGAKIDIAAYCDYIKRNDDIIEKVDGVLMASVMDAIGDAEGTLKNQQEMERLGVKPLPCFHFGEDPKYVQHYVANYDYITLGGLVAQESWQIDLWLDEIFEKYLIDGAGRLKTRVHGFGVASDSLMRKFPFTSCDASSWVQGARVGGVLLLPEARNINVSERSPQRKVAGQHLDNLPEEQRIAIIQRLESEGLDLTRARETYLARWCFNLYMYSKLGKMIADEKMRAPKPFERAQPGLF